MKASALSGLRWIASALLVITVLACAGVGGIAAQPDDQNKPADQAEQTEAKTPEQRMNARFPQPVRAGALIGWAVLDDNDVTLGHVQKLVRTPDGHIKLIVSYSRWFGWFGRPVAVPIEAVAALGRQLASLDMPPADYERAPTWTAGSDQPVDDNDMIRIALTRR